MYFQYPGNNVSTPKETIDITSTRLSPNQELIFLFNNTSVALIKSDD